MLFTSPHLRRPCVPTCISACTTPNKPSKPANYNPPTAKPFTHLPLLVGGITLLATQPAAAIDLLREEPANALSLPTWAIHVSSVVEWVAAMVVPPLNAFVTWRIQVLHTHRD